MFDKTTSTQNRHEAEVLITLTGQEPFEARVFLKHDERLIDLLNDPRAFIPVRRTDGTTLITSKHAIVSIVEIPPPAGAAPGSAPHDETTYTDETNRTARPHKPLDPYEVLRVNRNASLDEIRAAYKARMKAVHPDAIAALDLNEDIVRAAHVTAQKVNHAYRRVLRERGNDAEGSAANSAA